MIAFLKQVFALIPNKFKRKSIYYLILSFINVLLDLVSVAYIVPIIIFLVDKEKLRSLLQQFKINVPIDSPKVIYGAIGLMLLVYVIKNLFQVRLNTRLFKFLHEMASHLSEACVKAILNQPYLRFQKTNKGDAFQNVLKATNHFCVSLVHSIMLLLSEGLFFILLLLILIFFYPLVTLGVALVLLLFAYFIYQRKRKQIELINNTYNTAFSKANAALINILDGYLEIRSSENLQYFVNKFNRENNILNRVTASLLASSHNYSKYLETSLVFGLGALVVANFLNHTGDQVVLLALIAALAIKIIPSLTKILTAITLIRSHKYSVSKLNDVIQYEPGLKPFTPVKQGIALENISFSYDDQTPLIEGLNLSIEQGDMVGVTGISGIGKTTLLLLTSGMLKPQKGVLVVDGVPVPYAAYKPFFSYVTQHPFLFNASILDNIVMGQPPKDIDFEYVNFLLEKLQLSDLVAHLKDQIHTEFGHNSLQLSGGQKQRIAIARALYRKPPLLVLDEATNQQHDSLERKIYTFLRSLSSDTNMAVLTVTHNDKIFSFCDRVFALENGKLLKLSGK